MRFKAVGVDGSQGNSIAVNALGNVYVTGFLSDENPADFPCFPQPPGPTNPAVTLASGAYFVSYRPDGERRWVEKAADIVGYGVAVDGSGSAVYVTA